MVNADLSEVLFCRKGKSPSVPPRASTNRRQGSRHPKGRWAEEGPPSPLLVAAVNWKGHTKRLKLEPGGFTMDVPLSACVTKGDRLRYHSGDAWVIGKNGDCKILQPYVVPDVVNLGGDEIDVLIKEITEPEEHTGYQALADYHYRGKSIHGRTARLIVRTSTPRYPKVLGYIELATPFFMNKPRSQILNAPFDCGNVSWDTWDMPTLRRYIHVVVRIARTVVSPEFRGANIGQLLVKHASSFAKTRWQVAGYLPQFLEISADMLKYVPFAERAGMTYVGHTQGNLHRVSKDMRYLIDRFRHDPRGKSEFEKISGILDQQVARMDRFMTVMEQEDLDSDTLYSKLEGLSQKAALRDFALFQGIVSLPKPHYMAGLSSYAESFLKERVSQLGIGSDHVPPRLNLETIDAPIALENITIEYCSQVRRTSSTHAVQQAFDISPDQVRTTILRNLTFTIEPGSIVLVLGPSGSGKTSLLKLLTRTLDKTTSQLSGTVTLPHNYEPGTFQDLRSKKPLIDAFPTTDVNTALYLLGLAGLSEPALYLKRYAELSGGQQYRAMLSMLIGSQANVWLADEFCAHLDPATAKVVAENIQRLARRLGATVVAAAPHCDHFVHSLRPDVVVMLTSSWEHSMIAGPDYLRRIAPPASSASEFQRLTVATPHLTAIKAGATSTIICKGRKKVAAGMMLVSDGNEYTTVTVRSSATRRLSTLSSGDIDCEGSDPSAGIRQRAKAMYPELSDRSIITIIRFEPSLKRGPLPHLLPKG